jgi:hypothetical protein
MKYQLHLRALHTWLVECDSRMQLTHNIASMQRIVTLAIGLCGLSAVI